MARVAASLKLLLLTVAVSCENNERTPLHFLYITSDGRSYSSAGAIPAVDIALEKINGDSTLLPGYTLNYTEPLDSECNRSHSLNVFFGELRRENPLQFIAVVGCGCSIATEPVAEVSHYYNIPMISFASSAEVLRDRNRFPSYFRTDPSEEHFSPGLAGIIRYYGWRQIAIVTQTESLFLDTQEELIDLLDGVAMTMVEFHSEEGPLSIDDQFFTENDVRVFILNMYANHARTVLCQAFHREMYHPGYVWITPGWYGNSWWRSDEAPEGSINCTDREMQRVLDRSLAVLQYPIVDREAITASGITAEEFLTEYDYRVKQSTFVPSITSSLAYDAIWALAVALNTTIRMISNGVINDTGCEEMDGPFVPFENFTYRNQKLWCLFHNNLQRTSFLGVSGDVTFDEHGTRLESSVRIEQYRTVDGDLVITPVAHLTNSSTLVYGDNESNSTLWPGGIPPDGIPLRVITTVSIPLTATYDLLAAAGLTFALMCLGFNIVFRKRKVVRLTSPNLNYLIIAGALLLYVSVVFIVTPTLVEETATIYCNVQVLVFSMGNTLCFAVVLAKMWRVYYIFNHLTPSKKPTPPKDWLLFIISFALVGIDMIILLVPMAIDTSRLRALLRLNQEQPPRTNEDGITEEYHFFYCFSSTSLIWLGISYAYKLLLQLTAVYFAFKTRKVKIKPLKDSKEIAVIIYITSLILVVSVATGFAVADRYLHVYVVIVGAGRLITPTVILGLVFVPKMLALYRDPQGKLIFGAGSVDQGMSGLASDASWSEKVHSLEKKIMELETKLREYQEAEKLGTILIPPQSETTFSAVNPVSTDTKDSTDSNQKSPNTSLGSE